jgi:uroporphyrinogen decarboxylase
MPPLHRFDASKELPAMSSGFTDRERVLATLAGERLDYVPAWPQGFPNAATIRRLIPPELLVDDLARFPEAGTYGFGPHREQELNRLLAFNQYIDQVAIGVGRGANTSFGHGGPGEFNSHVIEETAAYTVVEYETSAKAKINHLPHFYHLFDMPVRGLADLEALNLPQPDDPARWRGFCQDVATLKARGAYTFGNVNGFFSGCHYFFCDYQDFMVSLATETEFVQRLVARLGEWNLKAARMMLEAGVDCVTFVDDLGSERGLLFSPDVYERLFFPWHRALCDLAHSYGAHVHMHSHGNISRILERVVATGIDMLNPLDQNEGMSLEAIKGRYGHRLTLVGGMDQFIFDQDLPEIERRLAHSVAIGKRGGRYILMDTGSLPDTISREKFEAFLALSRRARGQTD